MATIKRRTFEKMASRFGYTYVRNELNNMVYLKKNDVIIRSFTGFTKAYFYIYEKHAKRKD